MPTYDLSESGLRSGALFLPYTDYPTVPKTKVGIGSQLNFLLRAVALLCTVFSVYSVYSVDLELGQLKFFVFALQVPDPLPLYFPYKSDGGYVLQHVGLSLVFMTGTFSIAEGRYLDNKWKSMCIHTRHGTDHGGCQRVVVGRSRSHGAAVAWTLPQLNSTTYRVFSPLAPLQVG